MATKNIHLIKKAVYNKLSSDLTLTSLLGGQRIYHQYPPQNVVYPCVIYEIVIDTDTPYNEDNLEGKITRTSLQISIFSSSNKSEESDNIESRIKTLLNGQRTLDTTDIICYGCERKSTRQVRDEDVKVWITQSSYQASWGSR